MKLKWSIIAAVLLAGCARFHPQRIEPAQTAAKFEARELGDARLKEFLEKNLHLSFAQWPATNWDFAMLNLAALYFNPSLDVARAQWAVALGGDQTAAQRPNPTLTATPGYDLSATGGISPWIPSVTFDLPLETAGKRGYRKAQARQISEAARLNIAVTAWQVRSNLRAAWLDLVYAIHKEALLHRQVELQEKAGKSLEQQLAAGAIAQSELASGHLLLAQARIDLLDVRQQKVDALARVADAIGVSVKALQGVKISSDFTREAKDLTTAEARQEALLGRADILAALAEFGARQSALQLEIAKQYPDIHLGPGYQFDQGDHKFSLSITAELPLFNQNQGQIAEATARRAEAAAKFEALQAKVIGEIDRAVAVYRLARENMRALEALASAQRKKGSMTEEQVKAGAAAQPELMSAQIELEAGDLLQLNGRMKLQQALAALENAVQRPMESMKPGLIEQSQRLPAQKVSTP